MEKQNYNQIWIAARQEQVVAQGGVLCTYAHIYIPMAGEINGKLFFAHDRYSLQQKHANNLTLIEDAWEEELRWFGGGACPFANSTKEQWQHDFIAQHASDFYNPQTLHIGRLTDAAIEIMAANGYKNIDIFKTNPYILYKPSHFSWIYTPRKSEPQQKRSNVLLLGVAASAIASLIG